jgi:hypothetical protein
MANAQGDAVALELGREFRLTGKQRQTVTEYCESHGQAYVLGKAEIVRSAPRKNAAGASLGAQGSEQEPLGASMSRVISHQSGHRDSNKHYYEFRRR